jgi:hypothetical protein
MHIFIAGPWGEVLTVFKKPFFKNCPLEFGPFFYSWTARRGTYRQGCQMACFQTKNHDLGKVWRVLQWKMLAC